MTVVGVVGGVRHVTLDAAPAPEMYRPMAQTPMAAMTMALAHDGRSAGARRPGASRRSARSMPTSRSPTCDRSSRSCRHRSRGRVSSCRCCSVFAGVGVVLGAVGRVRRDRVRGGRARREIGVRIALGAEPSAVAGSVVLRGVRYAVIGVAIGVVGCAGGDAGDADAAVRGERDGSVDVRGAVAVPDTGRGAGELSPGASGGADGSDGGVAV